MQKIYHMKGRQVNDSFVSEIRNQFQDDEDLIITIASDKKGTTSELLIKKLSDLEKKYPPKRGAEDFDFNAAVDAGINL